MADVANFMCDVWRFVLKQNIKYLRDNIKYEQFRSPLSKGILPAYHRQRIETGQCNAERIENLVFHLIENQPSKILGFLEILAEESNGHVFVFDHLKSKYDGYLGGSVGTFCGVSIVATTESESREFSLIFRHTLRRLLNENEMKSFRKLQKFAINKWNQRDAHQMNYETVVELSDLYFMALDSEAETKRLRYDTADFNEDVFQEMKNLIPNTSNPTRSSMQYHSRVGSYLNMSGQPYEVSKSHFLIAFQQSHTVEGCCEKGLLFYAYFNFISKSYDSNPCHGSRDELLNLLKSALDIFSLCDEQTRSDFQRVFFIKMAMVHLGIGIFGQELQSINISSGDINAAIKYLREVGKKDRWERMEVRRKMFYFICLSRLSRLRLDIPEAMFHLSKARLFARKGKFNREGLNIKISWNKLKILQGILGVKHIKRKVRLF
jgi:hypothetical protein